MSVSESPKRYIRFAMFDKNKHLEDVLCIQLKDNDFFLKAVEEFENVIAGFTACEDLALSLSDNEYYSIRPGKLYERLMESMGFHAREAEEGSIHELSRHLSIVGNSAALVVEDPEDEKKYFFVVNKANLRGRAAFSVTGEKLTRFPSDCFFIDTGVSLFASNKEIVFVDLSAASKILPIAKAKKEEERKACEKLLTSHGGIFSSFEIDRASSRKISIGKQILDLVEEMGEEKYCESVKKASKRADSPIREKLFDPSGKIAIDFKDENLLNFLAENHFHGELSNNSYVATVKKKNA